MPSPPMRSTCSRGGRFASSFRVRAYKQRAAPSGASFRRRERQGYLRIASGDDPNVILTFDPPAVAQLPFGMRRPVRTLGVHLAEPQAFVYRLGVPSAATEGQAAVHE